MLCDRTLVCRVPRRAGEGCERHRAAPRRRAGEQPGTPACSPAQRRGAARCRSQPSPARRGNSSGRHDGVRERHNLCVDVLQLLKNLSNRGTVPSQLLNPCGQVAVGVRLSCCGPVERAAAGAMRKRGASSVRHIADGCTKCPKARDVRWPRQRGHRKTGKGSVPSRRYHCDRTLVCREQKGKF